MISTALSSRHSSGAADVIQIRPPSGDIIQMSRVLKSWMFSGVIPFVWEVEECVCDSQLVFRTHR